MNRDRGNGDHPRVKRPDARRLLGRRSEEAARRYLEQKGYAVVATNVAVRWGEIDLVVEKDGWLVFVEVRAKTGERFGSGAESVDARKVARIRRVAAWFLQRTGRTEARVRFDVLSLRWEGPHRVRVRHIENAF
ncbi:YraN family protein [Calditerricola satsumensis]|uniref:UPF0102 protein GCM10007043_17650 n=1 Tax=Calditerricola satsumensis TaxID=373054 RepID=A0A8J3FDF0_9BACI|nr:YraN family protein [Calditerricola satsumensis]GGK04026.1 UPF0102 protein [Calditerricola satsumensis]